MEICQNIVCSHFSDINLSVSDIPSNIERENVKLGDNLG